MSKEAKAGCARPTICAMPAVTAITVQSLPMSLPESRAFDSIKHFLFDSLIRFHGVLAPNAKLRALVVPQEPETPAQAVVPAECEANCVHHRAVRLSWARLLKRVFELDLEHCPNCGGELKIIAAILEPPVIEKILTHLGLQARAPPRAPARGQALQTA